MLGHNELSPALTRVRDLLRTSEETLVKLFKLRQEIRASRREDKWMERAINRWMETEKENVFLSISISPLSLMRGVKAKTFGEATPTGLMTPATQRIH